VHDADNTTAHPETAPRGESLRALTSAARPKQWTKNAVVFAALVFDGRLFQFEDVFLVLCAAVLFCLVSSAGYLFNDLRDLDADQLHPEKRQRPLASGRLNASTAVTAIIATYVLVFPLAFLLSPSLALVLLVYVALMFLYSVWLKHLVIIDVLVISTGFVLRVVAGAVVISVPISPWLYVCTILLALFLALAKRRHELSMLEANASNHRRNLSDYSVSLLDQLILIVSASVVMAYSLYTFESEALPDDNLMMLTIPFVLYGIFRYLFLVHRRGGGGSPEQLVLEDRPLFLAVLLWGFTSVVILYGPWH
jgi:4-hydroxybenzoate polyprenyltransferase